MPSQHWRPVYQQVMCMLWHPVLDCLQVVEKCHELGILHGDLKPANFVLADRTRNPLFSKDINLLFGEPWLLAIDFGCSQYLGSQRFTKRTGTPGEAQHRS